MWATIRYGYEKYLARVSESTFAEVQECVNDGTLADELHGNQIDATRKELSFSVALIEEARRYPCIWNVSLNCNKDKPKKLEAWRRIAAVLNQPGINIE